MAQPDPAQPAGRVDWAAFLACVLPEVDLFLPSLDETLFMIHRARAGVVCPAGDLLGELSDRLLGDGATLVGLKLGDQGLYLRTSGDAARLVRWGTAGSTQWLDRELLAPCFEVKVAGTTGAGDSTVAGFIAGWLAGLPPEEVLRSAVAVGACCVEQPDATSGVPAMSIVQHRLRAGWPRLPVTLDLPGWRLEPKLQTWIGPRDASGKGALSGERRW
jgi:sugar/nucleoside kinase (ribokinase family)